MVDRDKAYTPRALALSIVTHLIQPRLRSLDRFWEPCCGGGSFTDPLSELLPGAATDLDFEAPGLQTRCDPRSILGFSPGHIEAEPVVSPLKRAFPSCSNHPRNRSSSAGTRAAGRTPISNPGRPTAPGIAWIGPSRHAPALPSTLDPAGTSALCHSFSRLAVTGARQFRVASS